MKCTCTVVVIRLGLWPPISRIERTYHTSVQRIDRVVNLSHFEAENFGCEVMQGILAR